MKKVVQTLLEESEYQHFRKIAKGKGLKVKEAARFSYSSLDQGTHAPRFE